MSMKPIPIYDLVTPRSEAFGPDLTFVEIAPSGPLASLKAIGSFWSLDHNPNALLKKFGAVGTPIASIGFPQLDYKTEVAGNNVYHQVRHMTYVNAIEKKDVFDHEGWDYLETTCFYGDSNPLPVTFGGVSGGPVWGMELKKSKKDGRISIQKSALIGITFYQTELKSQERRLRAHFIRSIYDLAWRGLN